MWFHDGTPFNAAAVCANFNRWYLPRRWSQPVGVVLLQRHLQGLQDEGPTQASTAAAPSNGQYVAVVRLTRTYGPLLNVLTNGAFPMASPAAMAKYGASKSRHVRHHRFRRGSGACPAD